MTVFCVIFLLLTLFTALGSGNEAPLKFGDSKGIENLDFYKETGGALKSYDGVKYRHFSIEKSDCSIGKLKEGNYIDISGLNPSTNPGEPMLPAKSYKVKLPENAREIDVKITNGEYAVIANLIGIGPTPQPIPLIRGLEKKDIDIYTRNEEVYSSGDYFPGKLFEKEVEVGRDYKYVYIKLYPLQYIPEKNESLVITNAEIEVSYNAANTLNSLSETMDYSGNVIITPPKFYESALELAQFHNDSRHVNSVVVNTTEIYSAYSGTAAEEPPHRGYRDPSIQGYENIKNYNYSLARRIISYLRDKNPQYVTLLGNARNVPPSYYYYTYNYGSYNNWIPTDFFYSSTNYNLTPQARVGRIPANNSEQAQRAVDKIKGWSRETEVGNSDWFKNAALIGGRPFRTNIYIGELSSSDYINEGYLEGMNVSKVYLTEGNYEIDNVEEVYRGDYGFIRHLDHGSGEKIGAGTGYMGVSDMEEFERSNKTAIVMSDSCMNGAFDTNLYPNRLYGDAQGISFGESVVINNNSGIAYLGGSRVNWGTTSNSVDNGTLEYHQNYIGKIFKEAFKNYKEDGETLGDISYQALEDYRSGTNSLKNRTILKFVLLGDPALQLPRPELDAKYENPEVNAIEPQGNMDASKFDGALRNGKVPKFSLQSGESASFSINSNASEFEVKKIDLLDGVVNESTLSEENDYYISPDVPKNFLLRPEGPNGKETWFYTYVSALPDDIDLKISGPNSVRKGEFAKFYGKVSPPMSMEFNFWIKYSNGTLKQGKNISSDSQGRIYTYIHTRDYEEGDYILTLSSGSYEEQATLNFTVKDYSNTEIFLLSSKEFDTSQCNSRGFENCRVWSINTSTVIDSSNCGETSNCAIVNYSESGRVHYGSISSSSGQRHIAVVDMNNASVYGTVFIDDDETFIGSGNESIPEKGFLNEGSVAGSIEAIDGTLLDIKLSQVSRNGESIVLMTPPSSGERPYSVNDPVKFIVMVEDEGNSKQGIKITPSYLSYAERASGRLEESFTDEYGLSSNYSFEVQSSGIYRISVNSDQSTTINVRPPFKLKYSIKDSSTGEEVDVVTPNSSLTFELRAIDRETGKLVDIERSALLLLDPDYNHHKEDLEDEDGDKVYEAEVSLEENPGTWTVKFEAISENSIREIIKTSIEMKTFKVISQPLSIRNGYVSSVDGYIPNSTGYISVFAVKLGSLGNYERISRFYPIDNPNTTQDECKNFKDEKFSGTPWAFDWGNIEVNYLKNREGERINISNWRITNVINSEIYEHIKGQELPPELMHQCIIEFRTPNEETSYSGNLKARRASLKEWEKGNFKFSVRSLKGRAYPWTPDEGWKSAFLPGANASVRIRLENLYTQQEVDPKNIYNAKIYEARVDGETIGISEQSFNKNNEAAWISFRAPNSTGSYSFDFMVNAKVNTSEGIINTTSIGEGYFEVRAYYVRGDTENYMFSSNQSVPIHVSVKDLSYSPVSGVSVGISSITNRKTGEEYSDEIIWTPNVTDPGGEATIDLRPSEGWGKGTYSVDISAEDSYGRKSEGWAWFRVKDYRTEIYKVVNGDMNEYSVSWGDNLTFMGAVQRILNENYLNASKYDILMDESSLIYYGDKWSRRYNGKKIPLTETDAEKWIFEGGDKDIVAVNLSEIDMEPGRYRISLKFDIEGERLNGDDWFYLKPFETHTEVLGDTYGSGDSVSVNISLDNNREFNVSLESLRGHYGSSQEEINLSSPTKSFMGSGLYNFTLPESAKKGSYTGLLKVSVGDKSEYDWIDFKVRNLVISPLKGVRGRMRTELDTQRVIYNVESNRICSEIEDIDIPQKIANNSCVYFGENLAFESDEAGLSRSGHKLLYDEDEGNLYVSTTTDFSNFLANVSEGEAFVDNGGLNWTLKSVSSWSIDLKTNNGLENGIIVNTSLSDSENFRFAYFNETKFGYFDSKDGRIPINLNKTDESYDNIYLLAVNSSFSEGYNKLYVGYTVENVSESSFYSPGDKVDLGTEVRIMELNKDVHSGISTYLSINRKADYYPHFGTRNPLTNISFPVMVTYPNRTPISGANVSSHKVMKEEGFFKVEMPEIKPVKTNQNGIAILDYNLTQPGRYRFVMKAQNKDETALMESYESPSVSAEWFNVYTNPYREIISIKDWEVQKKKQLEMNYKEWFGGEISQAARSYLVNLTLDEGEDLNFVINGRNYAFNATSVNSNQSTIEITDHTESELYTETVQEGDPFIVGPLSILVYRIESLSGEGHVYLSVGIKNPEFNQTVIGGREYNITLVDDPDYWTGGAREEDEGYSYDTAVVEGVNGTIRAKLGEYIGGNYYITSIDSGGYSLTLLNGSVPVLNLPKSDGKYLVSKRAEGPDINGDGDQSDEFYFVIYGEFWDDEDKIDQLMVNSGNKFTDVWRDRLPRDYVFSINRNVYFDRNTKNLSVLDWNYRFEPNETLMILCRARNFNWNDLDGNMTFHGLKSSSGFYNFTDLKKTEISEGYSLVSISPGDFYNLDKWPYSFTIEGGFEKDGKTQKTVLWAAREYDSDSASGGGTSEVITKSGEISFEVG